jgi:glycogen phosphorylase
MRLRATRTFQVDPQLPAPLEPLRIIVRNLFWTWHTDALLLFERMDRQLWRATGHNPARMLQLMPRAELERLAHDDGFLMHLERTRAALEAYLARPPHASVPGTGGPDIIAYFSLEFALTESLPNYSGGLGVLAGDHLKSASDLGLPLVGVGLIYHQGYFSQVLGPDGWQHEEYHDIDIAAQPLQLLHDDQGAPLEIVVPFDGRDVHARVWRLDVGKTPLILLDTNVDTNSANDRQITARLYGGDFDTRIQQEMVLGIGGVRALDALGMHPAVCHMNEGHSALLGVERIRMLMEATGASFDEARLPVTAATAFTTHTAVAAGIDLFPPDLVRKHLGHYYAAMGLDARTFIGLGRINPDDEGEPFSMALLGLRLSGFRNGVSKLHRSVSQRLWANAWPGLPEDQAPIGSITNGVHLPTWVSHDMGELYDRYVGPQWREDPFDTAQWQRVHEIPAQAIWDAHEKRRERLVIRAREQYMLGGSRQGLAAADPILGRALDPNTLTIGFARRFAGYKRATLLFRDPERLARIINNPDRQVQFIFAGKAHPRDEPGKQLIREVLQFSRRPEFRDRLVILEGYDVEVARALVQGCDVWLNTPLRPLEASGTSGMKAVANGAIHMSVLDGWWWEAYRPGVGWAVGRDHVDDDPETQDAYDAASLYDLLENEVAPLFYDRDKDGLPMAWIEMMKRSIARFAPRFNTNRMVSEYAADAYTPAARSWRRLREDGMRVARDQADWLHRIQASWDSVRVLNVIDDARERMMAGEAVKITVQAQLSGLTPGDVRFDAIYGRTQPEGGLETTHELPLAFAGQSEDGACSYAGTLEPEEGGRAGYVIRAMPHHADLHNPFATGLVHWA